MTTKGHLLQYGKQRKRGGAHRERWGKGGDEGKEGRRGCIILFCNEEQDLVSALSVKKSWCCYSVILENNITYLYSLKVYKGAYMFLLP